MAATSDVKLDPKYDQYDFPTTSPTAQSGHPGHTTPEQDAQVQQLRLKLEAAGFTERLDTLTLVCLFICLFLFFRGAGAGAAAGTWEEEAGEGGIYWSF